MAPRGGKGAVANTVWIKSVVRTSRNGDTPDSTRLTAPLSDSQVGGKCPEIARVAVKDFHQTQGHRSLHFVRKGGECLFGTVNPDTAQRMHEYLAAAGHEGDPDVTLVRPLHANGRASVVRRHISPDMVDRVLKRNSQRSGLPNGLGAHSMRATFITTALQNGASLEGVQRDVGHADPTTTKLYDRRGHNPEKSASFFANY